MDYTSRIRAYLTEEKAVLGQLDVGQVNDVLHLLERARLSGHRVFTCGNGGSAATASHFCCDFNKGVSLAQDEKYRFECLSDNVATITAIANDISYDDVFVVQLQNKLSKNDVLIGISGSGNSTNVVKAIDYGNRIGATTIGLVGYDGGEIKRKEQHVIHIEIDNMQIVEDVHMILEHVMMFVLSKM